MPDTPQQTELPLEAPPLPEDAPFLPARMVNEYVYCPRLAYLEWVQGEWTESADTVEGTHVHRRVDREDRPLPSAEVLADQDRPRTRSVTLSSRRLGLVAKIDMVESDGETVVPVDYKRGKRPHVAAGAYEPERVQICVQGLLLEENGYRCTEGALYFAESRERVRVVFDDELRDATRGAIGGLRLVAAGGRIPAPLRDSPKCPRCSLVGICLPDEVNHFRRTGATPRPIAVRHDEMLPLYVQANNARLAKKAETITITEEDGPTTTARLIDVSQVVLMGNVRMTTPCLHELMRREIPVTWHSYGGWFLGHTTGLGHKNVELREAQYRASFTPAVTLAISRSLVAAKVRNSRTMIRRNWRGEEQARELVLNTLRRLADRTRHVNDTSTLLGLEGEAAAVYFRAFAGLLGPRADEEADAAVGLPAFRFDRRNRRPPTDPGQCAPLIRLCHADPDFHSHAQRHRFRCLPRLLSSAPVRSARARPRSDGAVSLDRRGFDCSSGDQQRGGETGRLPARRRRYGAQTGRTQTLHRCVRTPVGPGDDASHLRLPADDATPDRSAGTPVRQVPDG